jgi:BMFP domain-containing protein YqiC
MNFEEKLNKVADQTRADMDKHIHSSMSLIKGTLQVMEREEALKQIEVMMRTTAELSRSYAVLNAVTLRLGHE